MMKQKDMPKTNRWNQGLSLVEVVLADNPAIEVVDRDRGIYRVPVTDAEGNQRYIYGAILVAWHLGQVSFSAFTLGQQLASGTGERGMEDESRIEASIPGSRQHRGLENDPHVLRQPRRRHRGSGSAHQSQDRTSKQRERATIATSQASRP